MALSVLEIEGLSFTYSDAREPFLCDIDLCLEEGEAALLLGSNGSGKSTLLRCIKPEIRPQGVLTGEIIVDEREAVDGHQRVTIGYLGQSPWEQSICRYVWQEMAFGLEQHGIARAEMRRRIADVGTYLGLDGLFPRRISELSGGQLQMVELASVLVLHPHLLLLDEPLSQLDPLSQERFVSALRHLNQERGMTMFIAAHEPDAFEGMEAKRFVLENGRLSEEEPPYPQPTLLIPLNDSDAERSESPDLEVAVSMEHLSFRYARDAEWGLYDINACIRKGEVFSLLGCNGCGKTTLLRLIGGTLTPVSGKIINGYDASQVLLPQDPTTIFSCDSVEEELTAWQSGTSVPSGHLEDILVRFGLGEVRQRHPLDLSVGQKQLLALAKLLLLQPDLIILDEPTTGLDVETRVKLCGLLREEAGKGRTVILSTHDLSFATHASDRLALLFGGEIMSVQTPREFLEESAFYRPKPDRFMAAWSTFDERSRKGNADDG